MRSPVSAIALAALLCAVPTAAEDRLSPGIWTNTEDEYFAEEEGREKPQWFAFEIAENGQWRSIDAFGKPQSEFVDGDIPGITARSDGGWQVDGSELRKAERMLCWIAVRKYAKKPDGSEDWMFVRNLPNFDQGGRVFVSGGGDAPDVTLRIRQVTWAKGSSNKPVRVLYIHTADPVRAQSYSWGAPDSSLVGINLRWVQASCSITKSQAQIS